MGSFQPSWPCIKEETAASLDKVEAEQKLKMRDLFRFQPNVVGQIVMLFIRMLPALLIGIVSHLHANCYFCRWAKRPATLKKKIYLSIPVRANTRLSVSLTDSLTDSSHYVDRALVCSGTCRRRFFTGRESLANRKIPLKVLAGKVTERWTDFARKGGNVH
jgi:hypothetical protein